MNSIETIKAHLRITSGNDEDTLLDLYSDAARDWIQNYLDDETPIETAAVQAAHLLLVADLYENREAQITKDSINENPTVLRLLSPYRKKMGV